MSPAATALSFRLARSFDEAANNRGEAAFARVMTPVVKYWVCKIAPALLYEAMECLGGNGYVEEAPLARYYREAPVNAIWEGSGNVMALDVLRVLGTRAGSVRRRAGRHRARSRRQRARHRRRAARRHAGCDVGRRLGAHPDRAARAVGRRRRTAAAWGQGASPTPSSRRGSPASGARTYGMLDARHDARMIIDTLYPAI